ncbi:hypothetical protein HDU92_000217 [Lobulomyces angularis]|nr:hypothetical protein HDU92_000217 [Lobulomyces angularis]
MVYGEISPNLIANGDAEAGDYAWNWNNASGSQVLNNLQVASYSSINITRGILLNQKHILALGQSCFQASSSISDAPVKRIFSATQTILLPEYARNSTLLGLTNFKFSASFIRYFSTKDYVTINLSFTDINNKKLNFNSQDALSLVYKNDVGDILGGNIKPFWGNSSAHAYFFSEVSNGTVPINSINIVIDMIFYLADDEESLVSKAFVDNLALTLFYLRNKPPSFEILEPETIQAITPTGYIGIFVGGLGLFLLFIVVPLFTCFKKQASPILKRFTLKRRNSKVTLFKKSINRFSALYTFSRNKQGSNRPYSFPQSSPVPVRQSNQFLPKLVENHIAEEQATTPVKRFPNLNQSFNPFAMSIRQQHQSQQAVNHIPIRQSNLRNGFISDEDFQYSADATPYEEHSIDLGSESLQSPQLQ